VSLNSPLLYLDAFRVARPRQLAARTLRPINRRRTYASRMPREMRPVESGTGLWRSAMFSTMDEAAGSLLAGSVKVLGVRVAYPPADWTPTGLERLRRFHLHYGDEIVGCARRGRSADLEAARVGLESWITSNPPGKSDGWHPYPLSTRIGNWIAAMSLEPALGSEMLSESLWRQLVYLERNIEDDILGNHVIRNARALVLGGVAFAEDRLVARGLALLARELPEQVLSDGGHYERSPVYHAIVLRDLLEIRAVTEASHLDAVIGRMKGFAAALTRPDGQPSPFNDAPLDLAPDMSDELSPQPPGLAVFRETGYAVVRDGRGFWLAFDCGRAAPNFLPPHAHADGLSFQLWLDGKPFVVDPGTYTYEAGSDRDWLRGTRSHSTVAIDGTDQFELWGAFRASRIPAIELLDAAGSEEQGTVAAELHGFPRVSGRIRHRRRVSWSSQTIEVADELEGHGRHFVQSALPLAAGIEVEPGPIAWADGVAIEAIGPLTSAVEMRAVSERLFERVDALAVVMRGELDLPAAFGWKLSRRASAAK
jgi:Heparinase II/III-like protein/Heparinase II/III N-terminus